MGFKPAHNVYQLVFHDMPELEVMARGASLGKLLEISALNVSLNEANRQKLDVVFKFIAKRIITWNVEHPDIDEDEIEEEDERNPTLCPVCGMEPGDPMPTTAEALMCLDLRFVMQIFFGWMQAVARIPVPKGLSLPAGETNFDSLMKQLGEHQNPLTLQEQN